MSSFLTVCRKYVWKCGEVVFKADLVCANDIFYLFAFSKLRGLANCKDVSNYSLNNSLTSIYIFPHLPPLCLTLLYYIKKEFMETVQHQPLQATALVLKKVAYLLSLSECHLLWRIILLGLSLRIVPEVILLRHLSQTLLGISCILQPSLMYSGVGSPAYAEGQVFISFSSCHCSIYLSNMNQKSHGFCPFYSIKYFLLFTTRLILTILMLIILN